MLIGKSFLLYPLEIPAETLSLRIPCKELFAIKVPKVKMYSQGRH
jgi:hypothetical protein